ncbi:MAG: leucine-rich repeat protein [Paludibacteraceae bacterium]|nr:leucine-rich repeat protein [Paludibacteraceae bacterium]
MKAKIIITMLLAVVASSYALCWASDTAVNGIWYDFDNSTMTASVTYYGNQANRYTDRYINSVSIPSSVVFEGKEYSVTEIGDYAFYLCKRLKHVSIPNSVTKINFCAFCGCDSLTSIDFSIGLTSVGEASFAGCGISSLILPDGVTCIGNSAFGECDHLKTVIIPNSVTTIESVAFRECDSLQSVMLSENLAAIGHQAFCHCPMLTSITIPNSVTTIEYGAFWLCYSLRYLSLGAGIKTIGEKAFAECQALAEIHAHMPSPPAIDQSVFVNCGALCDIDCYVPKKSLESYAHTDIWKIFHLVACTSEDGDGVTDTYSDISDKTYKHMQNGHLLILRDGKTYTAQGQEVR